MSFIDSRSFSSFKKTYKAQGDEDGQWVTTEGHHLFILNNPSRNEKGESLDKFRKIGNLKVYGANGLNPYAFNKISSIIENIPQGMRATVNRVEISAQSGNTYSAGGEQFNEAGSFRLIDNSMRIWDGNSIIQVEVAADFENRIIPHEFAHGVYNDMQRQIDIHNMEWNDRTQTITDDMESKGIPWMKSDNPNWVPDPNVYEGKSINTYVTTTVQEKRDTALKEIGGDKFYDFQKASMAEGGCSPYARAWMKNDPPHPTENFAEMTRLVGNANREGLPPAQVLANYKKSYSAWRGIMKHFGATQGA